MAHNSTVDTQTGRTCVQMFPESQGKTIYARVTHNGPWLGALQVPM